MKPDINFIVDLENSRLFAMRTGDIDYLEENLHDNFSFTHMNGLFETKPEFIQRLQQGNAQYREPVLENISCSIFEGTSILTGTVRSSVELRDSGQVFDMHNRFISVWIFEDDRWKAAAYQSTSLPG